MYFCCAEALQNVTKHAGASRAWVRVTRNGNRLQFEVSDDGRGFNPGATGGGTGRLLDERPRTAWRGILVGQMPALRVAAALEDVEKANYVGVNVGMRPSGYTET